MSRQTDNQSAPGTTQDAILASDPALTFPNSSSDWTFVSWVRLYAGNIGTTFSYFCSSSGFAQPHEFNLYFTTAADTNPNYIWCDVQDSTGANGVSIQSTTQHGLSTAWLHLAITYDLATRTVTFFVNNVSEGTGTFGIGVNDTTPPSGLMFGNRNDGNRNRWTTCRQTDTALFHRKLSGAEIASLAAGNRVSTISSTARQLYVPWDDQPPTERDVPISISDFGSTLNADEPFGAPPSGVRDIEDRIHHSPLFGGSLIKGAA